MINSAEEAKDYLMYYKVLPNEVSPGCCSVTIHLAAGGLHALRTWPEVKNLISALELSRVGYVALLSEPGNCACEPETNFICGYTRDLIEIEEALAQFKEAVKE